MTAQLSPQPKIENGSTAFWTLLEGGYIGTIRFFDPALKSCFLKVQQLAEANQFGTVFCNETEYQVLQAEIITKEALAHCLMQGEMLGEWSFATVEESTAI